MNERVAIGFGLAVGLSLLGMPTLAASFRAVGDLAGGPQQSIVSGISGNGQVIVGASAYGGSTNEPLLRAVRWNREGVPTPLGFAPTFNYGEAFAASFDGSVIVGYSGNRAVRFVGSNVTLLDDLAGGGILAAAYGVSDNGALAVGFSSGTSSFGTGFQPVSWSGTTVTATGDLAGGVFNARSYAVSGNGQVIVGEGADATGFRATRRQGATLPVAIAPAPSRAWAVNGDGTVVVGSAPGTGASREAFRWVNGNLEMLGDLPGGTAVSEALAVTSDGTTVVGYGRTGAGQTAFIWTASTGLRSVVEVLQFEHNLVLTGWQLLEATGISDDGTVIVGNGISPQGTREGWIIDLAAAGGTPGDTDLSGCVDDADLTNIILDFGGAGGSTSGFAGTDINADNSVDDGDLIELILNFGAGC